MAKAAKLVLGKRPKNFPHVVTARLLTGEEVLLPVRYRYRTRTEFGEFVDGLLQAADVKLQGATEQDVDFSLAQAMERLRDQNAQYLLQIIDDWELEEPLSLATLQQLCDELPGIAIKAMSDYRAAITEGRLGN
jgi:hypothetical protein